jgi:hypothetical protein
VHAWRPWWTLDCLYSGTGLYTRPNDRTRTGHAARTRMDLSLLPSLSLFLSYCGYASFGIEIIESVYDNARHTNRGTGILSRPPVFFSYLVSLSIFDNAEKYFANWREKGRSMWSAGGGGGIGFQNNPPLVALMDTSLLSTAFQSNHLDLDKYLPRKEGEDTENCYWMEGWTPCTHLFSMI